MVSDAAAKLEEYHREHVLDCTRCPLSEGRTQVVAGSGSPDSDIMFVGEAPGYHEDKQGIPFVGQAGKLLDTLLAGIGLSRDDVFVANVLKCRPPGNRDPLPSEIDSCQEHLYRQISIIQPALVATLGNFATKLLSGRPDGISRVHGCELPLTICGQEILLYPLYHPAAALYSRAMLPTLEADVARMPELIASVRNGTPPPAPPERPDPPREASGEPATVGAPETEQLGLF